MPHYKDQNDKLYFLDSEEHIAVLPVGHVKISDVEAGSIRQRRTPEQIEQEAKGAKDREDEHALKSDKDFKKLLEKTPAQVKTWVESSFPSLTIAERKDLSAIACAVAILGRRM